MKKYDSISFCSRRHVASRRVNDRRSIFKQEYPDHIPERRVSMIDRRMNGDRRQMFSEIMKTFWEEAP